MLEDHGNSICVFGTNSSQLWIIVVVVVVVLLTVSAASNVNNRLHFIIEHIFRRNCKKKKTPRFLALPSEINFYKRKNKILGKFQRRRASVVLSWKEKDKETERHRLTRRRTEWKQSVRSVRG